MQQQLEMEPYLQDNNGLLKEIQDTLPQIQTHTHALHIG